MSRVNFKLPKIKDDIGFSMKALPKDFELMKTKFNPTQEKEEKRTKKGDLKIEISLSNPLQNDNSTEKIKCYRIESAAKKLRIGKFDSHGDWDINERDLDKISKHFELFYMNKLKNITNYGKKNNKFEAKVKPHPIILETSKVLANNRKERMIYDGNNVFKYFYYNNNIYMHYLLFIYYL